MSWSFGAPGHGKGTWDGLGGIFKSTARNEIIAKELVFVNAKEFFDFACPLFDSSQKREKYEKKKYTVKRWNFFFVSEAVLAPHHLKS